MTIRWLLPRRKPKPIALPDTLRIVSLTPCVPPPRTDFITSRLTKSAFDMASSATCRLVKVVAYCKRLFASKRANSSASLLPTCVESVCPPGFKPVIDSCSVSLMRPALTAATRLAPMPSANPSGTWTVHTARIGKRQFKRERC